jgi:hypothetical protein
MIEWTGPENKIGVEGQGCHPVGMIFQRVQELATVGIPDPDSPVT